VAFRRQLLDLVSTGPRTPSSLARELGLDRRDMEEDLRHMIRSARAAGHVVVIEPARCKACGFLFDEGKLARPGKCPACRGSRLFEPRISVTRRKEDERQED
jgi:predicted Zn-ribbon and HTH transcriptional regulator